MEKSEKFRKVFKDLLRDLDCKESEVPDTLNITYEAFVKIRDFGWIPTPIILIRIADHFNVSLEYLLGMTEYEYFEKAKETTCFQIRYEELKNKKGLTDYKIAGRLHISTSYTTNWKRKNRTPSLNNLILLAEFFDVSIDYLLGRTDDDTPYRD